MSLFKTYPYRYLTKFFFTFKIHFLKQNCFFSCPNRDVRLLILEYARWSMIDKYRALMDGLSLESLLSFVKEFKSQLFVEGLVQGNVTSTVSVGCPVVGQVQVPCRLWNCISSSLKLHGFGRPALSVCLEGNLAPLMV